MAIPPAIFQQTEPIRASLRYPLWQYVDVNAHYAVGDLTQAQRDDGKKIALWWRTETLDPAPSVDTEAMPGSYNPNVKLSVYFDEWYPGRTYTFHLSSEPIIVQATQDCHAGEKFLKRKPWFYFSRGAAQISSDQSALIAWLATVLQQQ